MKQDTWRENADQRHVGERLRQFREKLCLSQEVPAERMGERNDREKEECQ